MRLARLAYPLAVIITLLPSLARADMPGKHPAYLHALSDLRHARAHLERRGGNGAMRWDEHTAIAEIDAAIQEIKEAAIDDGKGLEDHPPVDVRLDWSGRLHRAVELLERAHADVRGEEDNDFARGLRRRALHHIDEAIRFTREGIASAR